MEMRNNTLVRVLTNIITKLEKLYETKMQAIKNYRNLVVE
jgi:hypothetical protein